MCWPLYLCETCLLIIITNSADNKLMTFFFLFSSIRGMFEMNFYLETSNFKLAQKYSFHALEVLPVARNAKFQPMYPLLEGVTVR